LTQKQREEYAMQNYYQLTVHQQLNLSSLLMAAAGPSLVISTTNNNEVRYCPTIAATNSSTTNLNHQMNEYRQKQRLAGELNKTI